MADVMGQEQGLLGDIDLDYLLQEFPDPSDLFKDDLYLDLDLSSEPSILDSTGSDSSDSFSSWANELEQFLLAEDGEVREEADERFHGNFFSGMSLEQSDELKSEVTTPEADDTEKSEDTTPEADGTEKSEILVVEKEEDEDPISKKRRRQMRSRDSAIKERRNLYIKDLEMKSGLLESERGRLDQVCRCFTAENLPLHHHLLKGRVFGALVAKQESALLLMGIIPPLGSLFWFVSVVLLFLLNDLPSLDPIDASRLGRGLAQQVVGERVY